MQDDPYLRHLKFMMADNSAAIKDARNGGDHQQERSYLGAAAALREAITLYTASWENVRPWFDKPPTD